MYQMDRIIDKREETTQQPPPIKPPDGGFRAYTVMIAAFTVNGVVFGIINSYGVVYNSLEKHLKESGFPNSETRAALVGSLALGTTFAMSPVGGVLTGVLGFRFTAVFGGTIATSGMLISSFFPYNTDVLNFTYGIMYGFGASLAYNPSLAILGHYFQKNLGKVNGVVTVGSSVFTVFIPPVGDYMIYKNGLGGYFRVLTVFSSLLVISGLSFKALVVTKVRRDDSSFKSLLKSIINVQIWKNKKYVLWVIASPLAVFGYFVPFVYMKRYIEVNFAGEYTNLPIQCLVATSAIGRLIFGTLTDRKGVDIMLMQQMAFYAIGVSTIILPFIKIFGLLITVTLIMGIFDGAYVSLIGPLAFNLVGKIHAAQAIGCMLGIASVPLSVGPPIAGLIYNLTQSFTLPFVLAGIAPLCGSTLMFLRYTFKKEVPSDTSASY